MKPIDVHAHLWGGREQENAEFLAGAARRYGIGRIVVCPIKGGYYPEAEDVSSSNAEMRRLVREHSDVLLGCPTVDPRRPEEVRVEVDKAIDEGVCCMVKVWVSCRADSPDIDPTAQCLVERGLTLLIHSFYKRPSNLKDESTAGHVADLARRFPDLQIIMAHMAMDWELGVKAVRDVPNIAMDFSGSIWQAGAVEKAVAELGAARVLFGTDAPGLGYPPKLGQLHSLNVSAAELHLIARGNAVRLLGLEID